MTKGMLLIISGPSGSGKGTVVKRLVPDEEFSISVSVTTREKRENETEGADYFFMTVEEFTALRDSNQLLEHASFCGHLYGTPRFYVEEQIELGKTVVLEIEVLGALQVKEIYPECVLIFLMPPSLPELKKRLINRGTENSESIELRIKRAMEEISLIENYDYLVINDKVENAVDNIKLIVSAEKLKPKRNEAKINTFYGGHARHKTYSGRKQ